MHWAIFYGQKKYGLKYGFYPTFQAQQTKDRGYILYGIYSDGNTDEYGYLDLFNYYFSYFKTDSIGNMKWKNDQLVSYYSSGYNTSLSQTDKGDYLFLLPHIFLWKQKLLLRKN